MPTYQIWYMRPEYFRNGIMGHEFCEEHKRLPDPKNLEKTHVFLKDLTFDKPGLEQVFMQMQGEIWSPNGEACSLIKEKGLRHTSMSVGDVIVANGVAHMVDNFGFEKLGE